MKIKIEIPLKLLCVAFIILIWDSSSFVMNNHIEALDKKDQEIALLLDTVAESQKQIVIEQTLTLTNEQLYKDSVIEMVQDIRRSDSFLNVGGQTDTLTYDVDTFISAMINSDLYELNEFFQDATNFFSNRVKYFDDIPNIWPVLKHPLNRITSQFGPRFDPFTQKFISNHGGIDIDSYLGAPVIATADGEVKDHWIYHKDFGRCVRLGHNFNFMTFYGHMSKVIVHEGDHVKKGQIIGYIGSTGKSTGPHIHYEIVRDGIKVDPIHYLRRMYEK